MGGRWVPGRSQGSEPYDPGAKDIVMLALGLHGATSLRQCFDYPEPHRTELWRSCVGLIKRDAPKFVEYAAAIR